MTAKLRFVRCWFACVAFLMFFGNATIEGQDQPNLLWIIGDDWGQHASVYGTAAVETPNLDQLAAEGTAFRNIFSTAPVCSAMRSALITGMYQTTIGAHHHRTSSKPPLPAGIEVITEYFRAAGYYTSNGNANQNGNGKTDYNFQGGFNSIYDGNDWRDRPAGTPFFSQVQIFNPHRSFFEENSDPNRVQELELPAYYPDHPLARKDYADYLADTESFDNKVGNVLNRLANDGLANNTIVMVFGDHGAPHVRDKQWLYDGGIRIPLIVRDPTGQLIAAGDEGAIDTRMVSHIDIAATSLDLCGIDVPDHMQGISFADPAYAGRDAVFAAKDRLDGVVDRVRSVQVGNVKLIRNFDPGTPYMLGAVKQSGYKLRSYPVHTLLKVMNGRGLLTPGQANFLTEQRPEFELYDLSTDPSEFHNLAEQPEWADVFADLQNRLDVWGTETNDMGGNFDPDAAGAFAGMLNSIDNTLSDRVAIDATDYEYLQWWTNRYDVELGLPESSPDLARIRLPNPSFENTVLANGTWDTSVPQGWSESFSTVVQNHTANQMAVQALDGANALILNSDGSWARWGVDDNWGNRVQFDEALWRQFRLDVGVGRRSDNQGVDAGILEVSLQTETGETVLADQFLLEGNVQQGQWESQSFVFRVDAELVSAFGPSQIYLNVANKRKGLGDVRLGRVLLDDLRFSISLIGDFDASGEWDQADLILLHQNFGNPQFDVDGDGDADFDDRDFLLNTLMGFVNGDANGDGTFNIIDVTAFVLAITDPATYDQQYPNQLRHFVNDFNYDGVANLLDVGGFVAALVNSVVFVALDVSANGSRMRLITSSCKFNCRLFSANKFVENCFCQRFGFHH